MTPDIPLFFLPVLKYDRPLIYAVLQEHLHHRNTPEHQKKPEHGMFAVNGILFNHESERRGETFVTRKITLAAGRIAEGLQDHLELGNMDSLRAAFWPLSGLPINC